VFDQEMNNLTICLEGNWRIAFYLKASIFHSKYLLRELIAQLAELAPDNFKR
jgi:hypothetical protein